MPSLDLGSVVGQQGEQGATGAQGIRGEQGLPGPNQVTNSTATPLTGVLTGNGSVVGVANIDAAPTADSTGFAQSGGTDKAIKGRVPVYGLGKNLLDNPVFVPVDGLPVNQRGLSSYSSGYTIDRWKIVTNGTVNLTSSGLSYTRTASGNALAQFMTPSRVSGRSITASVLLGNGTLISQTADIPASPVAYTYYINKTEENVNLTCYLNGASLFVFQISTTNDSAVVIQAAKLELGSEQTLCHNEGTAEAPVWVLNEVPDYEYELYRCITSTADPSDTYANKSLATGQQLAYVENGTTATKTNGYSAGEYFCWHGALYKAKTAIGNGDTFTENTNCEQATGGGFNNVTKPIDIKSECVVNDSVLVANNLQVTLIGRVLLISGNTYRDINGTNITVITLPSRLGNAKKAYFYVGGYGGSFVGEGYVQNQTVVMNISSSSNNGVFNVMTTI